MCLACDSPESLSAKIRSQAFVVTTSCLEEMAAVAGDAEAELRVSIAMAARIIREVRTHCAGVHIMALGWEDHIPAILAASGVR